jgi:hypothetical protein
MARTPAVLGPGVRITDHISLGVVARTFPVERVRAVLRETGRESRRERDLPAHVVVYYVIALALYMQSSYREVLRCLLEGIQWLMGPGTAVKVAGKSGISQARTRLGWKSMQRLHDEIVQPIATPQSKGCWYGPWRLVSLDGSTLDVADEQANDQEFGRPGVSQGKSAYPQLRFVALAEIGTHVLFGARLGPYGTGEITLAREVLPRLGEGMLCLADRNFFSFALWNEARARKAELLWRVKKNMLLPRETELSDGSYLSRIYASERDRRHKTNAVVVRVIEYRLEGVEDAEPVYLLVTTILQPERARAEELAALYHQRWEMETALDELKTHLRGPVVMRSKTPSLVRQEFYGLMMAHFAVRGLMLEAALKEEEDPDRISFIHTVRVIRRKMPQAAAIPPSGQAEIP